MKIEKFVLSFIFGLAFTFLLQAQEDKKVDLNEIAEQQLESLSKDVDLDDFQKLELLDFFTVNTKKIKAAMDSGMDQSNLRFLVDNNSRELDDKLKEVLLPKQFENYMHLKRERAINGESKGKKKKKLKKSSKSKDL